jgi:hypothetical protein
MPWRYDVCDEDLRQYLPAVRLDSTTESVDAVNVTLFSSSSLIRNATASRHANFSINRGEHECDDDDEQDDMDGAHPGMPVHRSVASIQVDEVWTRAVLPWDVRTTWLRDEVFRQLDVFARAKESSVFLRFVAAEWSSKNRARETNTNKPESGNGDRSIENLLDEFSGGVEYASSSRHRRALRVGDFRRSATV